MQPWLAASDVSLTANRLAVALFEGRPTSGLITGTISAARPIFLRRMIVQ